MAGLADPTGFKRTPLYDLHMRLGARMVPFAGYDMPVQYPSGIIKEHLHTRAAAGLFDVSHMGQIALRPRSGRVEDAARALEALVPGDIIGLAAGRQRYTMFTNAAGGVLDDLMVSNQGDHLMLVVNAARKQADEAHLRRHLSGPCHIEPLHGRALVALQGPKAEAALGALTPEIRTMAFMEVRAVTLLDETCTVSRSGYTGEDGFEISVPAKAAEALCMTLLRIPVVAPVASVPATACDSRQASVSTEQTSTKRPLHRGCLGLDDPADTPCRRGARGRLRRKRADPWTDRKRRAAPPCGAAPGRPCTSTRRSTAVPCRKRYDSSRYCHIRRVRSDPQRTGRHGLCSPRSCHPGDAIVRRGARQAPSRHRIDTSLRANTLQAHLGPFDRGRRMLKYTKDHEWLRMDGAVATVGITPYAQEKLGDLVFVELPKVGTKLDKGAVAATVESVKAASEVYAPVGGEVTEVNDKLATEPGLVNAEPTGNGWMFRMRIAAPAEIGTLLDEAAYKALTASDESH